jgi:exodeoxyribonuclease V gamma subunit
VLRVVYSNRTEELLSELALRVRAQQAVAPLAPVPIVVSSAGVEKAVRLGVARATGIAANLEVSLLTRFAAGVVEGASGVRVADGAAFEAMALALFLDEALLAERDVEPLRRYLGAAGGNPDAVDARRVQLAARVGRIFEQYSYSRGDMLSEWQRADPRDPRDASPESETLVWQRRLYRAMLAPGGLAEAWARRGGPRVLALHDAVEGVEGGAPASRGVHVFALSPFARSFEQLFLRLARTTDVVLYALSPCEGFWEDVDPRDPPLLHLWGRPGREHVRALNAASGFDHDDRFVDPLDASPPTLLRQLQADILHRNRGPAALPRDALARDESLVVLEHASIRRELEAVASEIWRLVDADPTLRFDAIAVVLPEADLESYLAHLPVVFHESHALPLQVAGASLAADSRILEAIELLFALPSGRFTRQELLRLALHPAVVASLDDVDPTRWLAWCDALGIVHGADRADHEGTYIERDILNWDQGLRRLALGAVMSAGGDAGDGPPPFEVGGEEYVPLETAASEMRDAVLLGALLRSLIADARFVRAEERTLGEWAEVLCTLVETYVAPTTDVEEEHLATCLRCVRSIGGAGSFELTDVRVRYTVARDLVLGRLVKLPAGRTGEGVVAGTLAAPRPLPFRVVFACGLSEGRFPSPDAEDPLDLRWAARRPGDVTARERDKYSFLELLLAARDRVYASYVSRDPLTGDRLAPSSVVQDVARTLATCYGDAAVTPARRHPLRRWNPDYFPDLFPRGAADTTRGAPAIGSMHLPEAREEAVTLALREALRANGARLTRDDVIAQAALDPAWRPLADHLGLAALGPSSRAMAGRVTVPMYALVKFLEFPLQGWAKYRVGLDEVEEDDAMAREDEPFETPNRDLTVLLREVFFGAGDRTLADAYDAAAHARELVGAGPSGVFARGERDEHVDALGQWRDGLVDAGVAAAGIEVHRFGRAGEHARSSQVRAPLVIDLHMSDAAGVAHLVRVEIGGRTLPLSGDLEASVILHRRNQKPGFKEWADADLERMLLRAFVDHAVLAAAGVAPGRARRCVTIVASPGERHVETADLAPTSQDEAVVWLRAAVKDLLGAPHAYFFPCEAVFVHRRNVEQPMVPVIQQARTLLRDADGSADLRSAYGPVPRLRRYPIPDEETARSMAEGRFGAFFEKVTRRSP